MEFIVFLLLSMGLIPVKLDIPTKNRVFKVPAHIFCNLIAITIIILGGI